MPPPPNDDDLLGAIAAGNLDLVYCLQGAERFLVDRCLAALKAAVLGAAASMGLNHDVYELRESGLSTALTAAQTLPMFAKRRLVVARGLDLLKTDELAGLIDYLADPNPSTCLVFTAEKIDARFKPLAALKKAGFVHEFPRLRDRELPSWISREARSRSIAIDSEGAQALAEAAGPDLGRLSQALEQLSLYVGPQGKIGRPAVEELIAETRERGVFELTKAIGEGNPPRALALLANMLANREPPLRIQYMLVRQLRQIWKAKELAATGAPRQEIAAAVGIAPFFLDDVLIPARRMSEAALERGYRRLYQSDRNLKGAKIDPDLAITRLVRRLAEDAAAPAPSRTRARG